MVKPSEWLSRAWALVQVDLSTHVLIALIIILASGLTAGLLAAPLMAAYYRILLHQVRDPSYRPMVGDLGEGFDVFVQALLAGLVIWLASVATIGPMVIVTWVLGAVPMIGQTLAAVAGAAVSVGFIVFTLFVLPLISDRRLDFWTAIRTSVQTVAPRFMAFLGFGALIWLLNALGATCCGLGALVTMPVAAASVTIAYGEIMGAVDSGLEGPAQDSGEEQ